MAKKIAEQEGEGTDMTQTLSEDGERLQKQIETLKKCRIKVGFQAGATYKDTGEDVVTVAAKNEFGFQNIPSRPFMRNALEKNRKAANEFAASYLKKVGNASFDVNTFLELMGEFMKSAIQKEISEGDFVPNSPYTIAKKGSDKPLIDTGLMRQSVTYVIEYDNKPVSTDRSEQETQMKEAEENNPFDAADAPDEAKR